MTNRDKNFYGWLAGIIACGFIVRLVFLILYDNVLSHEAEAYSKINLVSVWILAGKPYPDINFGPLHTWIIHALTFAFDNKVMPVRLFSLLCGALALLPYGLLVRQVFDDKVALGSAALLAAFPVHLRGSATSLALAPYILFLASGLYFHFKYRFSRRSSFWLLVLSALFLNMAGMLRFESWLFLPLLCLFLVRKNFWHAVGFGAMNLAFPLTHMAFCYMQTKNPLAFSATSAASFRQYMPGMPMMYKLTGWFVSFGSALTIAVAVLVLLGLFYAAFTRKGFHFAALFLFNLGIFQYRTMTNTIDPALVRYTAGMSLLLFPFAAYVVFDGAKKLAARSQKTSTIIGAIVMAILAGQMLVFAVLQAGEEPIPKDAQEVVAFLRENVKETDYILPDSRFHPYFMVESQVPTERFVSLYFTPDRKHLREDKLAEMIAKTPPRWVVIDYVLENVEQVNSNLDAFTIPKGTKNIILRGLEFSLVSQYGDFAIYQTTPVKEETVEP